MIHLFWLVVKSDWLENICLRIFTSCWRKQFDLSDQQQAFSNQADQMASLILQSPFIL